MDRLKVSDLMTNRVYTVGAEDDLSTVSDLFDSLEVRHLPVVDQGGELLGVITVSDLGRLGQRDRYTLPLSEWRGRLQRRKVREVMTEAVETATPDDDLGETARLLLENKLGCLPVLEGGRLVGVLTEADFVRFLLDHPEVASALDRAA